MAFIGVWIGSLEFGFWVSNSGFPIFRSRFRPWNSACKIPADGFPQQVILTRAPPSRLTCLPSLFCYTGSRREGAPHGRKQAAKRSQPHPLGSGVSFLH